MSIMSPSKSTSSNESIYACSLQYHWGPLRFLRILLASLLRLFQYCPNLSSCSFFSIFPRSFNSISCGFSISAKAIWRKQFKLITFNFFRNIASRLLYPHFRCTSMMKFASAHFHLYWGYQIIRLISWLLSFVDILLSLIPTSQVERCVLEHLPFLVWTCTLHSIVVRRPSSIRSFFTL